jgi:hypothetical protein
MNEKHTTHRHSHSPSFTSIPVHNERNASLCSSHGKPSTNKAEEIARIDALATGAGVTLASFAHLDEKAILRKMDLRLIPMLALLYLLSFLDRGNIGNAKIEGLTEDLNMTGAQYNWCLTVHFHLSPGVWELIMKGLFLPLRLLRSPLQPPPQETPPLNLVTDDNGSVGYRHDVDGYREIIRGPPRRTFLPRCH